MGDITGANATFMLSIPVLFPVPQQIQGFAADDVFDIDQIESVETLMGVDGVLSMGWTWKPQPQRITLQADSPSLSVFETWYNQMRAAQRAYPANALISIPAIGRKYVCTNGGMTGYKNPGVKKLVQPLPFSITWNNVVAQPI